MDIDKRYAADAAGALAVAGIFVYDMEAARPDVTWLPKLDGETDIAYLARVNKESDEQITISTWRRGGNNSLGLKGVPDDLLVPSWGVSKIP